MNWYLSVLKKYAVFYPEVAENGRASRSEFWWFVLFNFIISFVLGFVDGLFGMRGEYGWGLLGGLYALAVLLPSIGVAIRRLHDSGKTGWWLLISFIPIIGFIVLLVFYIQDSEPGPNQYGENPKGQVPA